MITFTYTDNSEAVDKALANFQSSLADQAPALQALADDFRAMIAEQFASEGRAEGTPWAPRKSPRVGAGLAPPSATLASPFLSAGQAPPLLVRTGALRDSLIGPSAPGHIEETDEASLTIGSRLPYAMFHQLGTRRMPARPMIVLTDARAERWLQIVQQQINEKILALGAKELGGEK
ncbi:MAG: phage virion morphogenesis protein [Acidobacteriia bacterium]|nr:phage virion morphogenesis protein [Terriglobia bacterium]